jgi:hypothetical protein
VMCQASGTNCTRQKSHKRRVNHLDLAAASTVDTSQEIPILHVPRAGSSGAAEAVSSTIGGGAAADAASSTSADSSLLRGS